MPKSGTAGLGAVLRARVTVGTPREFLMMCTQSGRTVQTFPQGREAQISGKAPQPLDSRVVKKNLDRWWVCENLGPSRRVSPCFNFLGDSSVRKHHEPSRSDPFLLLRTRWAPGGRSLPLGGGGRGDCSGTILGNGQVWPERVASLSCNLAGFKIGKWRICSGMFQETKIKLLWAEFGFLL